MRHWVLVVFAVTHSTTSTSRDMKDLMSHCPVDLESVDMPSSCSAAVTLGTVEMEPLVQRIVAANVCLM